MEIEKETASPYAPPESDLGKKSNEMGLMGLFVRFFLVYIIGTIALGVVLTLIKIEANDAITIGVILAATMYSCKAFAKKNQRFLTKKETIRAIIGFSLINLIIKMLGTLLVLASVSTPVGLPVIIITLLWPIFLHTPLIWFSIWTTKKSMLKRGEIPDIIET